MAVRLAGSCVRPASSPSVTGAHGGRAVVVPIAASSVPCSLAYNLIAGRWQRRPWQGPIVTVV